MSFLKSVRKFIIGVIVLATLNLSTACNASKKDEIATVEKMLQEKYGVEFIVTEIGNRYNTGAVTLHCHPSQREDVNFTATYKYSTEELTDDYIDRNNAVQLDCDFSNLLKDKGFNGRSLTIFYGSRLDNVSGNETLEEFIEHSNTKELYIYLVMDEHNISGVDDAQKWLNAIAELSEKYNHIDILLTSFWVASDDYADCSQKLQSKASVNDEWFESYNVISNINIKIRDKVIDTTADDIVNALKR